MVGSGKSKIDYCLKMGADFVINKQKDQLWKEAEKSSPAGYFSIFDANGIETLSQSYDHLSQSGRVITYGFHSNLPKTGFLSPFAWLKLIAGLILMPRFDPMELVLKSKSVCGFNLSFFSEEHELIAVYLQSILAWVESGQLKAPDTKIFDLMDIAAGHAAIQSGLTTGKLLVRTTLAS